MKRRHKACYEKKKELVMQVQTLAEAVRVHSCY